MSQVQADAQPIDDLEQLLGEQSKIYQALVDLSKRKRELIIKGGTAEFERLMSGEQALLWQAGRLEERRFAIQQRLAESFGMQPGDLTLITLAARCTPEQAGRLRNLQKSLVDTIGELGRLNEINTALLKKALGYVNAALGTLAQKGPPAAAYSPSGARAAGGETRRIMNRQA